MVKTLGWVLEKGNFKRGEKRVPANLKLKEYEFNQLSENETIVEPVYGCWEGNMTHAIDRKPIDICRFRREDEVIIGNAGVVKVIETGSKVTTVKKGDYALLFANGIPDHAGYMELALGYDAPNLMGILAKKSNIHQRNLIPIPKNSKYSLKQWAAFSLRYVTAWSNWKLAYGTFRLQLDEKDCPNPYVAGWGGGVAFAELQLAQLQGCQTAMITSQDSRIDQLKRHNITPIDRRDFPDLYFQKEKFDQDLEFRKKYRRSERIFLEKIREAGKGQHANIFIDNIGAPVFQATIKAISREGVVTTCGWKEGEEITNTMRTVSCIKRHQHINTHYARYNEGVEAVKFAEESGWMPEDDFPVYNWENVPELAKDYKEGKISSYFPLYQVNPE